MTGLERGTRDKGGGGRTEVRGRGKSGGRRDEQVDVMTWKGRGVDRKPRSREKEAVIRSAQESGSGVLYTDRVQLGERRGAIFKTTLPCQMEEKDTTRLHNTQENKRGLTCTRELGC